MNYQSIYDRLIERRRSVKIARGDKHHVLPRSWGGSDEPHNIVKLTKREHFLAHLLLVKLSTSEDQRRKMLYAVRRMVPREKKTGRNYQRLSDMWVESNNRHMNEIIGDNGESRCELTTRKSAHTMATTVVDGLTIAERRFRKMSKHNTDVHEWEHASGNRFTGTAIELSREFRGELIEPSKLTRNLGTPEYHRGWRSVEGGKCQSALEKRYTIIRKWVNRAGEVFIGTSYELSEHVKPKQTMHPSRIERFALKNARLDGWKVASI